MGTHAIAQKESAGLKEVTKLKLELTAGQKRLRQGMEPHVNTVVSLCVNSWHGLEDELTLA